MTEYQHPVTPPPNLRRIWAQQAQRMNPHDPVAWLEHVATQAARWGADAELEACCEWIPSDLTINGETLRDARRPKPPSLAEQALENFETISKFALDEYSGCEVYSEYEKMVNVILSALKRLQELEKGNE